MSPRIQAMTDQECRSYYRRIRARSEAKSKAAFDAAVQAKLVQSLKGDLTEVVWASPQQWVEAAREVRFLCKRCAGTGMFITMVENGQPKGPGGECFRCQGRGTQNDHDVRRNEVHDQHYMGRCAG